MYCFKRGKTNKKRSVAVCQHCVGQLSNKERYGILSKVSVVLLPLFLLFILIWISHFSISANKTADMFIEAYMRGDWNEMNLYGLSEYSYLPTSVQELINDSFYSGDTNTAYSQVYQEIMQQSQIRKSTIITYNNNAEMKIKITGPDMSDVIENAMIISNDKYNNILSETDFAEIIIKEMENTDKKKSFYVTIPMKKVNGNWYIDFHSEAVMDTLLCGLMSACKETFSEP